MNNLQKIKAAAGMGYSALVLFNGEMGKVMQISEANFLLVFQDGDFWIGNDGFEDYEITGYIYCGHLFGEPIIPEGTRFRVKETGEVFRFTGEVERKVRVALDVGYTHYFYLLELEPVFD